MLGDVFMLMFVIARLFDRADVDTYTVEIYGGNNSCQGFKELGTANPNCKY